MGALVADLPPPTLPPSCRRKQHSTLESLAPQRQRLLSLRTPTGPDRRQEPQDRRTKWGHSVKVATRATSGHLSSGPEKTPQPRLWPWDSPVRLHGPDPVEQGLLQQPEVDASVHGAVEHLQLVDVDVGEALRVAADDRLARGQHLFPLCDYP